MRLLGRADDERSDGGNGHQHFDRKGRPGKGCHDGPAGDRHETDQHRNGESVDLEGRHEMAERVGYDQAGAGEYRQAALFRFPPRAIHRAMVMAVQAFDRGLFRRVAMVMMVMCACVFVFGRVVVMIMIAVRAVLMGMISGVGMRRAGRSRLLPQRAQRIAQSGNLLFDRAEIARIVMLDRHRAGRNRD